jgi:hypothetical protein
MIARKYHDANFNLSRGDAQRRNPLFLGERNLHMQVGQWRNDGKCIYNLEYYPAVLGRR